MIDLEQLDIEIRKYYTNNVWDVETIVKAAHAHLQLMQSVSPDEAKAAIEWTNREFRGRTIYEGHPIQTIDTLLQAFAGVQS